MSKGIGLSKFEKFHVTGIETTGRRFSMQYDGSVSGYQTAMGINLWRGSVWRGSVWRVFHGKRHLLKKSLELNR